jgi:DtxR family Mn-dependent transcriptional regulator
MATETVENYLKAIFTLRKPGDEDARVPLGDVAGAVGVTPGTATTMVKKLAGEGLVRYERYGGVQLTVKGERAATAVLRRHRLIETFLVKTLGMDWSEVHEDAERLEHAVSDALLERLDRFLGRPSVDPHGDPIPDIDGRFREARVVPVGRCKAGSRVRLARVMDQSPEFLRFLDRNGLRIGSSVVVQSAEPGAGTLTLKVGGKMVTIAQAAAGNLMASVAE